MNDYKEEISKFIAETKIELQDGSAMIPVVNTGRLANFISSLPSEQEIAKGWFRKWVVERSPIGIPPFMSSLLNEYFSWLDKEKL